MEFTLEDLIKILRTYAGEDADAALGADSIDRRFADLGYESIALMEAVGRIKIDHGVTMRDEAALSAETPRDLIRLVNEARIAQGV